MGRRIGEKRGGGKGKKRKSLLSQHQQGSEVLDTGQAQSHVSIQWVAVEYAPPTGCWHWNQHSRTSWAQSALTGQGRSTPLTNRLQPVGDSQCVVRTTCCFSLGQTRMEQADPGIQDSVVWGLHCTGNACQVKPSIYPNSLHHTQCIRIQSPTDPNRLPSPSCQSEHQLPFLL